MPTYHFISKVCVSAHTLVEASTLGKALDIAKAEDRQIHYHEDNEFTPWIMSQSWVIREIDSGPEEIHLHPIKPVIP